MKIKVKGVPPWDGEYELADWEFTNRESHRIKEISKGIRGGELMNALANGDAGAWVGVTVVVAARHGKDIDPEDLWDAPEDAIQLELGAKADADPPTQPESSEESNVSDVSSGADFATAGV